MIKVSPGPLPADGTRINIQAVMDSFIAGTRVFDFDESHFADADLTFLSSQTDAPEALTAGAMWFARGEGKLKRCQPHGQDSGASCSWVTCSDRKELLVYCRRPWAAGEVLWIDSTYSEARTKTNEQGSAIYLRLAGHDSFLATDETAVSIERSLWDIRRLQPVPPYFIANDTGESGSWAVVTDVGYCTARYSGESGAFGTFGLGEAVPHLSLVQSGYANESLARVASAVDPTPGATTLTVFKHPGVTNLCL